MMEWIIILLMLLGLLLHIYRAEKKLDRKTKAIFDALYDPTDWEAQLKQERVQDDE